MRGFIMENSVYMFKNPIRHFLNVENIIYPSELEIGLLSWTRPANFTIRKSYEKDDFRILKLPNMLNFFNLYLKIKKDKRFYKIQTISENSRMKVNLKTGDFKAFSYKEDLEIDLLKLAEFDLLLKLDIKSFYESIYTHNLSPMLNPHFEDRYISNNNMGVTKGILMGSYVSLYLAELMLSKIAIDLKEKLKEQQIDCKIKYFSDDFYIFINSYAKERVIYEFTHVLHRYELTNNSDKTEEFTYLSYNNNNVVDKYWNKIISLQEEHNQKREVNSKFLMKQEIIKEPLKNRLNFLTQLIYRKNKIQDKRLQSILVNGFFKGNFFIDLDVDKYEFTRTDLHKILFLIKEHPEILLYVIPKFKNYFYFVVSTKNFFEKCYLNSLAKPFNEEQIYYYYALKNLHSDFILKTEFLGNVIRSNNQILISYYVHYGMFDNTLLELLSDEEEKWFLNYHIINRLKSIKDIDVIKYIKKYLVPKEAKEGYQATIYSDFYKKNMDENKTLMNLNPSVNIEKYLEAKKEERENYKT